MTRKEIVKKAGQAVLKKYGRKYFLDIGKLGVESNRKRYGIKCFSILGKLGVEKQRQNIQDMKCIKCGKKIKRDNNKRKYCSDCSRQRKLERGRMGGRKWRKNNPEENKLRHQKYKETHWQYMKEYQRNRNRKIREEVIDYYGGKCKCCGENRREFLSIDHIGGGGTKHRKEIGQQNIYQWLKKNNYPKVFRVLCHNCNMSIGFYGYCPHNKQAKGR